MRRRQFVALVGGGLAAAARPAVGQTPAGPRRIGALFSQGEGDPEAQARAAAFRDGLRQLGWVEGRNLRIEYRWAAGSLDRLRALAAELVRQNPEFVRADEVIE